MVTIEQLRTLATEAGHYIDSEVHDFINYVESVFADTVVSVPSESAVESAVESAQPESVSPAA
jgi:hypothetical protein